MITIEHTVSESVFVHAQVAAELTQKIKPLSSPVRLVKDNASVDANSILSIIGMAIKGGDHISFILSGDSEKQDAKTLSAYLSEKL